MLSNDELASCLQKIPEVNYVQVKGDGYHYQLIVVSDAFLGKTKLARQQWVYAQLKPFITSGALHAVSMTTLTNAEWEKHG